MGGMAQALRILHVDDDPELRQIVAMSLGLDPAIEVSGTGDAHEVIACTRARTFDALLLDYSIGPVEGVDLLAQVRATMGAAAVPALFLTARVRQQEHMRMLSAGATAVLLKPFDPLTLARDVRTLLSAHTHRG